MPRERRWVRTAAIDAAGGIGGERMVRVSIDRSGMADGAYGVMFGDVIGMLVPTRP